MTGRPAELTYVERLRIWDRARAAPGIDPMEARTDETGMPIRLSHFGDYSRWGWRAVPITPPASGGDPTDIGNLKPLHWLNAEPPPDGTSAPETPECPWPGLGGLKPA